MASGTQLRDKGFDSVNLRGFQAMDHQHQPAGAGTARWVAILLGLVSLVAGIALWTSTKTAKENQAQGRLQKEESLKTGKDHELLNSVLSRFAEMQKENADLRTTIAALNDEVEVSQANIQTTRNQVLKARSRDGETLKHLAVLNAAINEQLAAKASSEDVKTVSTEIATIRSEIKTTNDDFQMTRSETGALIARNHDEIEALRRIGDRDYFEFRIAGKNRSEKMGDVIITLRGTDPHKNEFNLQLFADDKRTEKRNRTINEPIFFYRHGERRPAEIVINQVSKNEVVGYLSTPKETQLQPTLAGAN
jgi:hypothetical protein